MDWPSQCAVVIPCFNEAGTIGALVREIRLRLPQVIVVDDGSRDDTARHAGEAGAEVLRHAQNCGKGAALRVGLKRALERGFRWALCMDGDGQHAPADIPTFLRAAEGGRAGMIVGNRMENPTGMPRLRRFANRWMSRRLSRLAGQTLPDTQCGFRLVELGAWEKVGLQTDRFEIESELLLGFVEAGVRIEFVPVQSVYRSERSKIQPLRDTWRWFRWLLSRKQIRPTTARGREHV